MGDLVNFGRSDPAPVAEWTKKSERDCKVLCLKRDDCDAFTYLKKERKCTAHLEIVHPNRAPGRSFWAKTCPGVVGEKSEYWGMECRILSKCMSVRCVNVSDCVS